MLAALATGTLVKDPQRRQSAKGKDYATAILRVPAEDADAMLVNVITFADTTVTALLELHQGDAVAIAGRAKLTTWEKNGERHTGLSVVADRVMTTYEAGKQRKAAHAELEGEQ